MAYVPGARFKIRNRPELSEVAVRVLPVSVPISLICAFGTTALAGSTTVPCSELETVCPNRQAVRIVSTQRICVNFREALSILPPENLNFELPKQWPLARGHAAQNVVWEANRWYADI